MRVAHAQGMSGTFSPPPQDSNPDMHHGTCVTYVPWCMPGSLTSGFLGSRWRGKCFRHSRCMRNPQYYVSGERARVYADKGTHIINNVLNRRNYKRNFITFSHYNDVVTISSWTYADMQSLLYMRVNNQPWYDDEKRSYVAMYQTEVAAHARICSQILCFVKKYLRIKVRDGNP